MGFRLFVLPGGLSKQLPSTFGGARGAVVSWANRPVGIPSCRAPPRPAARRALGRADPPVVCPGFGPGKFPDMLCMKKIYKDKQTKKPSAH